MLLMKYLIISIVNITQHLIIMELQIPKLFIILIVFLKMITIITNMLPVI